MEKEEQSEKQPILRAPPVVLILLAVLLGFHLLSDLAERHARRIDCRAGAFSGAIFCRRFGRFAGWLGAGRSQSVQPFIAAWQLDACDFEQCLAARFRAPVAKRLGPRKFIFLFMVCVMFGGFGQIFVSDVSGYLIPIIGASGGVAGLMGAASRFAFSDVRWLDPNAQQPGRRLLRLSQVPRRRPVMLFIAIWLIMNLVSVCSALWHGRPGGAAVNIAWVAHLGGFWPVFCLSAY